MKTILVKISHFTKQYPLTRGMLSYAVIWPIGSCIQQKIAGNEKLDMSRAFRFCIFGSCFVAPTLYTWVRFTTRMWPQMNLKTGIKKALIEQVTYGPFAMVGFFFGMTLLESGTIQDAVNEVKAKFFKTYKVGVCVWPVLQTINFAFVPERNRVIYVSFCSLMWTSFLAYMKQLEAKAMREEKKSLSRQVTFGAQVVPKT